MPPETPATPASPPDDDVRPDEEPAPVSADEAPAPHRVGAITVTARRLEESTFEAPQSAVSLDGEDLHVRQAVRSLPEALEEVPGVHVQKTSHGQGSPFLRGFTGYQTLFLIDGIRLNHAAMRSGPNQYFNTVDPLGLERLEVVLGPGSVLYGSDAIGGTVNAITASPESEGRGLQGGGRLFYRFASGEDSHAGRAELRASLGEHAVALAGLSLKDYGDIIAPNARLPNTGYDEIDGDAKLRFFPSADLEVVLAYQHVGQFDVPRTHATVFSRSFRGTTAGTDRKRDLDQRRELAYAQAHWTPDCEWLSRLNLSLSFQVHDEREERVPANLRRSLQGFEDEVVGLGLQLESPSLLGTLAYGIEYYHDGVNSFFREFNPDGSLRQVRERGPVADESAYDLLGVYIQAVKEVLHDLELTLGGRFNYAAARAREVDTDPASAPDLGAIDEEFPALVGSARLLYRVLPACNVFAGVSQGFRAPNLSDLTRFDVARSGEVEVPAPDLDPERYVAFEGGAKLQLDEVEGFAAYHYTLIDGMIVRFPTGDTIDGDPVVTKDNVGDGFVQGVDVSLSWSFWDGFTLFGVASWIEGEADTFAGAVKARKAISRIPPASGLVGLRWESPGRRVWVEGTVRITGEQDKLSPDDRTDTQRIPPGGSPGYTVYGLRAGVELIDDLKVFAALENVTDVNYRPHGSGNNEPGINAVVGFDWRF
jgi:hemoglobin/transferrin/lactoferrin receptor protein